MSAVSAKSGPTGFLAGGGEMGALIRAHDWESHPLGQPSGWPQPLKTALRLMLNTGHPAYVFWGEPGYCFYNDAYRHSIGPERHPGSLGLSAREVWDEIWDIIGPQIDQVMAGHGATWHENQLVPITRHGRREDVYWTYSYGPIGDETSPTGVSGVLVICTETTEQVLIRRQLTTERERQHLMLQQMPGFAALLVGPDHRYEYVNDAYVEVAGNREFVGRTVREVFPDIADQGFYELLDQVYASGEPFSAQAIPISLDRPDGMRFVDLLYEPVRNDTGQVSGIFVGGYDVTAQIGAVDDLRNSESRLRGVLEGMGEGFVLLDKDFRILEINAEGLRFEGRKRDDLIGRSHWDVWPNAEESELGDLLKRAIAERVPVELKNHYSWADGRDGWFMVRAFPAADGLAIFYRDVSERELAERELRETEERLRLAVENAEIGFWDVDPLNDTLVWPPRTKAMFGISPDVPVSMKDFYGGLHPDDRAATSAAYAAATDPQRRALYDVEYRTVGKEDGLIRWVAAKGRGIFDDSGRCVRVAGTAIDITGRKAIEAALRDLNDTLEARVTERTAELEAAHEQLRQSQKLEAMGSLTGGVAHDFNNLLTPIVGALDMLQRKALGGEREQRLIAGAAESAERAKTLVQRLLAFARRQPLRPTAVDIGELVRSMAGLVSSTTGPQIRVVVEVAEGLPPAKADPNQLEMALLNLSVNARDAMPEGGTLRISASAHDLRANVVSGLRAGSYLCLSVADTGSGMNDDTLARAIEPFFSTKGIGRGTGLGLSMVHGLALQLGGALVIKSEPGLGTNVELWLPRSDNRPSASAPKHDSEPIRGRGTALLVDDEELVRMSTADMLADLGYHVLEAASAEDALQLIADGAAVDLLVTDHLMPGMTGTDLAAAMRERRRDLPVLLVSGYAEIDGIAPDLPRLTKPFRKDELATSLAGLTAADADGMNHPSRG